MDYSDRLRKTDWEVRAISLAEARAFIEQHHYAKGGSNTRTFTHGLFRMAISPGAPKNACSFLLARSVRAIELDGRFVSLVTYADESREHTGLVYRASGWTYVGRTAAESKWLTSDGRMVARKAGGRTRTQADMVALGHRKEGSFRKHKFVKHLHLDGRDLA